MQAVRAAHPVSERLQQPEQRVCPPEHKRDFQQQNRHGNQDDSSEIRGEGNQRNAARNKEHCTAHTSADELRDHVLHLRDITGCARDQGTDREIVGL